MLLFQLLLHRIHILRIKAARQGTSRLPVGIIGSQLCPSARGSSHTLWNILCVNNSNNGNSNSNSNSNSNNNNNDNDNDNNNKYY